MSIIVGIGEVLWDVFPDRRRPGGAPANVAYHAHVLGNRGVVASRVGRDALGTELRDVLDRRGIDVSFLQVDNTYDTGTVQVDLVDGEPAYTITPDVAWDHLTMNAALKELSVEAEIICFSTLGQRSAPARATIRQFLDVTRPATPRVLDVNLRPPFYGEEVLRASIQRADVVKMNQGEWQTLQEAFEVDDVARWLFDEHDVALVFLTKGAEGSELITPEKRITKAASPVNTSAGDVVGVGDAFLAAVCHHLLHDTALDDMLAAANRYAAYIATQRGGMPPVPDDVLDEVT